MKVKRRLNVRAGELPFAAPRAKVSYAQKVDIAELLRLDIGLRYVDGTEDMHPGTTNAGETVNPLYGT